MSTLAITKSYADGEVLLESDLDNIVDDVETFLNTTGLDDNNITAGGIGTASLANSAVTAAKLASDAVTTAKILDANVTTAKLALLGVTTATINDLAVTTGKINDLAVTTGKINDLGVTTGKLAAGAVTTAKITDANVTAAKIESGPNFTGDAKSDSNYLVQASVSAGSAIRVVRGYVTPAATITAGEGWSVVSGGTGIFDITFNVGFSATPAIVATPIDSSATAYMCKVTAISSSTCTIRVKDVADTDTAISFAFIAIGLK